ncbi:hypothetical protein [Rhodobacteraceae bacterium DSL-40]|uniref:hypothetical protein n=1 Tax=Amaricoccus sp. B4 TaxID=3368557 RepID=UPI000DAC949A
MRSIVLDPLLPLPLIAGLAALLALTVALAAWRGLRGWWLRALAALVIFAALLGPSIREEDRTPVSNIAIVVHDDSASNQIAGRPEQMRALQDNLAAELASLGEGVEVREVHVIDGGEDGTELLSALAETAAGLPSDRIAGAILLTDGEIHDPEALASFPAPVHVLLTGHATDRDRRVVIETAPAFAIVDEPVSLVLKVEDLGATPPAAGDSAPLLISLDGEEPLRFDVPVGRSVTLPVTLTRGGINVLQISTPEVAGELTPRNNEAVVSINGVRDRLRVLLVSGEPYPGERTWRNLLKSDSSVDLVHFTILRPPEKQDFVPVFELSLIAFPTQELFMEKVDQFDLIIFDRYKRRGILPNGYFANIARYVRDGGALLIATGSDFAGAESLSRSPLREVLPVEPTARVIEEGYTPRISETGARHPVTAGLEQHAPKPPAEDGTPGWGRWFRLVDTTALHGETVMTGPEDRPLLVLDRQGEGRIAVLASDHAWLWSRGFEGGGPQMELLRRLAHWLMKEPELEEEVLRGQGEKGDLRITRRTIEAEIPPVRATSPGGESTEVEMTEVSPGHWEGRIEASENGVWQLENGDLKAVAVVGPSQPKEFADPVSTGAILAPLAEATGGGILRAEEGAVDLRLTREDRVAAGRGWLGLVDREAYQLRDVRQAALAPGWLLLLLAASLVVLAWRREGR